MTVVTHWRQCPVKTCSLNIVYCKAHGGTAQAEVDMKAHIQAHPESDLLSMVPSV
jgi:hypothetical protein